MSLLSKQARVVLATLALAATLAGCGATTTASKSFKGEEHAVATRISDFQKHATEASQSKLCTHDLAHTIVTSLARSGAKTCAEIIKEQLKNVEDLTLTVQAVSVHGDHATATVKSTFTGKLQPSTLKLVKEDGTWKISGV